MPAPERRRPRRLAAAAFVALVALTACVAATYTGLFAAGDIRIVGTTIPRRELLTIAAVDGRSNVFHLDTGAVERRLEGDPRILEAVVTTALPDVIRISVTPRQPVAVVGEPATLVGPDGVVIGPADGTVDPLPVIRGGDLRTAAAAAAAMSASLRGAVESIVVGADGRIGVHVEAGFSADLGDDTELPAKAASLEALLRWASERGARIVSADLTVPGSPTAELEEGQTVVPST